MTERLYYDDPYLMEFTARVTGCKKAGDGLFEVRLDRSAFYPTSGGQPYDTGTIAGARVLDVRAEPDGDVTHVTDGEVSGEVRCLIDRKRREDHMQQHAGEHLLAGELFRLYGAYTTGLHLGHDTSTIDCEGISVPGEEELRDIERRVNARIQACEPIRQWFPDPAELESLPLRKPPAVKEHVRVVMMGDHECCACGGTHPDNTGKIGCFKLLGAEPARGRVRFTFACGMRAVDMNAALYEQTRRAAAMFSTGPENFARAAERAQERIRELEREAASLRRDVSLYRAKEMEGEAQSLDGKKFLCAELPEDGEALSVLASFLTQRGVVCLLGSTLEKKECVFAAPEGSNEDMGALMRRACEETGGRGGGKRDFARGSGGAGTALRALEIRKEEAKC